MDISKIYSCLRRPGSFNLNETDIDINSILVIV